MNEKHILHLSEISSDNTQRQRYIHKFPDTFNQDAYEFALSQYSIANPFLCGIEEHQKNVYDNPSNNEIFTNDCMYAMNFRKLSTIYICHNNTVLKNVDILQDYDGPRIGMIQQHKINIDAEEYFSFNLNKNNEFIVTIQQPNGKKIIGDMRTNLDIVDYLTFNIRKKQTITKLH